LGSLTAGARCLAMLCPEWRVALSGVQIYVREGRDGIRPDYQMRIMSLFRKYM
jgi:hypothetical protein